MKLKPSLKFLNLKTWTGLSLSLALVACSSDEKKSQNMFREAGENRPLVDGKYSLADDRKALDDLRAQVPEDKRQANDEMAFVMNLVSDEKTGLKKSPSEIRSKFDSILRKKRDLFDKDMRKERDEFTKVERKKRETFLKEVDKARDQFGKESHTREEKNEFYKEIDAKRSEFFSVERDKRNDYESDNRERRKNFEDYTRQKSDEFNQEMRAYQKRFDEAKKQREEEKKAKEQGRNAGPYGGGSLSSAGPSAEEMELEKELQAIKARMGTPLESGGQ